ncbi:MAG: hypothetical protein ABIM98_06850 [candidate division WOR-3 bacterium]
MTEEFIKQRIKEAFKSWFNLKISESDILIDYTRINTFPTKIDTIKMLFQNYLFLPYMDVDCAISSLWETWKEIKSKRHFKKYREKTLTPTQIKSDISDDGIFSFFNFKKNKPENEDLLEMDENFLIEYFIKKCEFLNFANKNKDLLNKEEWRKKIKELSKLTSILIHKKKLKFIEENEPFFLLNNFLESEISERAEEQPLSLIEDGLSILRLIFCSPFFLCPEEGWTLLTRFNASWKQIKDFLKRKGFLVKNGNRYYLVGKDENIYFLAYFKLILLYLKVNYTYSLWIDKTKKTKKLSNPYDFIREKVQRGIVPKIFFYLVLPTYKESDDLKIMPEYQIIKKDFREFTGFEILNYFKIVDYFKKDIFLNEKLNEYEKMVYSLLLLFPILAKACSLELFYILIFQKMLFTSEEIEQFKEWYKKLKVMIPDILWKNFFEKNILIWSAEKFLLEEKFFI